MADERHFIEMGLGLARLDFRDALGFLLGGKFETFQILVSLPEIALRLRPFALDFLEGRAQVFAAAVHGAEEAWKSQPSDVGIIGALTFARDSVLEVLKLALDIGAHRVKRRHAPFHFIDPETPESQETFSPLHDGLPFPLPASAASPA
jgi:hypothetical protein